MGNNWGGLRAGGCGLSGMALCTEEGRKILESTFQLEGIRFQKTSNIPKSSFKGNIKSFKNISSKIHDGMSFRKDGIWKDGKRSGT